MTDPDVPLLADLDAGLLDPEHAREVRRAAEADPRSAAVLDALAATRADLAAVPAPVAPPELVAGWLAALAAAPAPAPGASAHRGPAGVGAAPPDHDRHLDDAPADPTTRNRPDGPATAPARPGPGSARPDGRRPPDRRAGRGSRARGWVLVGAAAALVVGVLVLRPTGPPDVTRVELAAVARSTVGTTDLGEFTDPARRAGCLAAAGHAGARVFGGREVRLDGVPGVLLVLSTGELGVVRALVVTPECTVLADEVVGR